MSIFATAEPETFLGREQLCSDLEKVLDVINAAQTVTHLDVAEKMLENLGNKWKLNTKSFTNPVYQAIWERVFSKRNELIVQDIEFAHMSTTKFKELPVKPEGNE